MIVTLVGDELQVSVEGFVATVRMRRPPHNFIDRLMLASLADALEQLDDDKNCRAVVLAAEGKSFCAGADFQNRPTTGLATDVDPNTQRHLYKETVRLFRTRKPIVAAVQGAAIGGGFGLAMAADFRVTCAEARFSANFARIGFHPGMGLSVTLPKIVGDQEAAILLYTGRRVAGDEAVAIGLADRLAARSEVEVKARELALDIAQSAPLAVLSTRETLRRGLADAVEAATEREMIEQDWQRRTADFAEGVKAMTERRLPDFRGV